jgi:hypothetical protein
VTAASTALALVPGTCPVPDTGANTGPLTFYLGTHHPGWLRTALISLFTADGGAP